MGFLDFFYEKLILIVNLLQYTIKYPTNLFYPTIFRKTEGGGLEKLQQVWPDEQTPRQS